MQSTKGKRKPTDENGSQMSLVSCWTKKPSDVDRKKSKSSEQALCPLCSSLLPNDAALLNLHIDVCLSKMNREVCTASPETISDPLVMSLTYESVDVLPGLFLLHDFITEAEEQELIAFCDSSKYMDWKFSSFNGNCYSKYFGVKSQFGSPREIRLVREADAEKGEHDVPPELFPVMERLRQFLSLHASEFSHEFREFRPNECNINSYRTSEQHYLRPHFDDRTLSGPILMNLSLCGHARMTFAKPLNPNLPTSTIASAGFGHTVVVDLPRRCLQLVSGAARWSYTHEIRLGDILDPRRLSITWRQAGGKKGIQARSARPGQDVTSLLLRGQPRLDAPHGHRAPVRDDTKESEGGGGAGVGLDYTNTHKEGATTNAETGVTA